MAEVFDHEAAQRLVLKARTQKAALYATPVERIVDVIHATGQLWRRGGRYYEAALPTLERELSFSRGMIEHSLDLVPGLCDREALLKRLDAELGDRRVLDGFVPRASAEVAVRAVPLGVLLHVSAGNVFLGCIDSLIAAFLTKNISILKLSSRNQTFPELFARSLVEADPERVLADKFALQYWPGGHEEIENAFKRSVDAIIAWGGEDMVSSYRRGLPHGTTLIEHGPKISFQVVFKEALERRGIEASAAALARDIALWDQAACASPQNLFFEAGIDPVPLMAAIGRALDVIELERGRLDEDEQVEVLKERYRARLSSLVEGGHMLEGRSWLLHHEPRPGLRPSPLNRCLLLKSFTMVQNLVEQVTPYASVLQSCAYLADGEHKTALLDALAAAGVQRFAPVGQIMEGVIGAPHDGRFALSELTRLVGDEIGTGGRVLESVNQAIARVPFYKQLYGGTPVRSFAELKPICGADFAQTPLSESNVLLAPGNHDGYIFSSGGTTGKPKFTFFTNGEFQRVGAMLAKGYKAQGLKPGDRCANLFVAGNLWSSFMAVEKALSIAGAVQLPIGGMAEPDLILSYLVDFKPRIVFGLPSLLVQLAARSREKGLELEVPIVCFAGEHLNRQGRELLADVWRTQRCFSAGYASVDAGPIGYQCPHCSDREHHLFADDVHLEIVDGEAVVTSLVRQVMPVVHLRTGDHVEWSASGAETCSCGSRDPRFVLHGRCDGQINLWSCRIQLAEIEQGLFAAGITQPIFQVSIDDDSMTISIEGASLATPEAVLRAQATVYESCKDLRLTRPLEFVRPRLLIQAVASGALPRVPRTGKVRAVVDRRRL